MDRSTASAAWAALASVNFTVSMAVLPEFESPTTDSLTLKVDEVSSKPPSTVSLLFSELRSPVLRTAKAMRTMAVSKPVIPHWLLCSLAGLINDFTSKLFMIPGSTSLIDRIMMR